MLYKSRRKTMNKTELVEAVAKLAQLPKKTSEEAVNAVFNTITDTLAKGDKVTLVGFGTFEVRQRAARTGRNPATSKEIKIPASKAATFKAGKGLKDQVNR